jgi:hypothetical protein
MELVHIPVRGAVVLALEQHLEISIFPHSKCQWPEGKLSIVKKLDVKRSGCHDLLGRILSAFPFLACLCRYFIVKYFG